MANTPILITTSHIQAQPTNLTPDALDTLPVLSALLTATSTTGADQDPLLTKTSILPQSDILKHKLQKARAAVKDLPDIERTVEEQEAEIRELEERMERQRGVLRGLRELGNKVEGDEVGEGGEGEGDVMDGILGGLG